MEYVKQTNLFYVEYVPVVQIMLDDSPEEPEIECMTLLHWHRRHEMHSMAEKVDPSLYEADDDTEFGYGKDVIFDHISDDYELIVWWPLFMMDHSGTRLSVGSGFGCPWDSGQVGIVGVTKNQYKEWGGKEWTGTDEQKKEVLDRITGQIETLDAWHNGNVWGFSITGEDGDMEDSCWGFYGDGALDHMKGNVEEKYHAMFDEAWEARYD